VASNGRVGGKPFSVKMKFLHVLKFSSSPVAIDRGFPRSLNSPDVTRAESVRRIADAENRARPASMSLMGAVASSVVREETGDIG
jgi:hypothetical protein